jgi:multidrug efflux pump
VVIFSGVSLATLFTLLIVPSVYNIMARHTGSPNAIANKLAAMRAEASPS